MTLNRNLIASVIATFFGIGKFPILSGTVGSLAALPLIWVIHDVFNQIGLLIFAVVIFFIGIWASAIYISLTDSKDPKQVVIDEVVGQAITVSFVQIGVMEYSLAFIFFRFFDITKFWPANWAERHPNAGLAVMLDDVVAGIYAGFASLIVIRVIT